jgi:hypothetical protein
MTFGLWIGALPACAAAVAMFRLVGIGRRGAGVGLSVAIGIVVLFAIALPIDLLRPGGIRRDGRR